MKKIVFCLITTLLLGTQMNAQDYKNKLNKFDNFGEIHNLIMQDLVNKKLPNDLPINSVIGEIRKIIESNKNYSNAVGNNLDFNSKFVDEAIADYPNNYKNLIYKSSLSSSAKEIAQNIINLTFDKNMNYLLFITEVNKVESVILSSKLTDKEKEILLTSTSVARHSAYLWLNKINLDGNSSIQKKGGKGRGWIVVGADICGGLLAGFAGAAYGSGCAYYITGAFGM